MYEHLCIFSPMLRPGNFFLKAPRGGSFSLQQRCLWELTHHLCARMDDLIILHTLEQFDAIMDEFRYVQRLFPKAPHFLPPLSLGNTIYESRTFSDIFDEISEGFLFYHLF
jgi:hypothetical protein